MNEAVGLQSRLHFIYKANNLMEFQVKNPVYDHFIKANSSFL